MGTHGRLELTLLSRCPAGLIGSVVIARLRRRRHGRGRSRRSHRSFLATTCGCLLQLQLMLRSALIPLLTFSLCRSLLRATALQLLKLTPSCVGTPLLLFCKGRNACRLELSGDCIFVCPRPWRLRRRSWSRILNVQPNSESIPIHSDNLELCFSRHGPRLVMHVGPRSTEGVPWLFTGSLSQSVSQLFHGPAPRSPLLCKLSSSKGWGGKCTRSHVCCL